MLTLTPGVVLWSVAHLFKHFAPAMREGMGDLGKLVVTVALIGSLVMMISGYQHASGPFRWGRKPLCASISNVLMLLIFYMMVASPIKARITSVVRHPHLTFIKAWRVSHLLMGRGPTLTNSISRTVSLAVFSVILINRQDGKRALIVAHAHAYLGYPVNS